jgi:mannose-1-phosphate guanylyltransferase/mannose-6-phosphate isomerase
LSIGQAFKTFNNDWHTNAHETHYLLFGPYNSKLLSRYHRIVIKPVPTLKVMPVVLCGGVGTRLWPLSRASLPKQFLVLSGGDVASSLFQKTIERIYSIDDIQNPIGQALIVTNEDQRFLALDQLHELKDVSATLLLEPAGRNTAPALTMAAVYAQEQNLSGDTILIVTPADQTIKDSAAFAKSLREAVAIAKQDAIAILGIKPTSPETGYGYIKTSLDRDSMVSRRFVVESFVDKPVLQTA